MSSNQFVNSILQIKPFVTGEFVKLHINFIGFIERYAQPDTIFTIDSVEFYKDKQMAELFYLYNRKDSKEE